MILLDGHGLTIEGLWRIARGDERGALAMPAREAMARSRALVEELAAQPRAIYGISTGFGPLSHERVSPDEQADLQLNLLYHLAVGQGEPLSDTETRAVMAARANALARGFSGIRPEVVEMLLDALGAGVLPEIPSELSLIHI
ncbi:MAG: aromatic amino acid ammonia-lyase, partial [Planctomycetota bacterium]|nr:aromatic amino acid ammonia-lyase [Planctomycetota bacterium]